MSYQTERAAIETLFETQWAAATPIGFDGFTFEPSANSVRLTIQSGVVLQGSIGRVANRIDHVGVVQVNIYTDGGDGSQTWRGYAETVQDIFFEKVIDSSGVAITTPADAFIRFSPQNQHPYIAATDATAPYIITTVNAPFVRYEYK